MATVLWDPKTHLYVGLIPGIPGAHTQAGSLDELRKNLQAVLELCLEEAFPYSDSSFPSFVGIQHLEVSA